MNLTRPQLIALQISALAVTLLALAAAASASEGDRAHDYAECVAKCVGTRVAYTGTQPSRASYRFYGALGETHTISWPLSPLPADVPAAARCAATLPLELQLTRWTCRDDCKYRCMHGKTDARQHKVVQYHGKWPFRRILGMQEPASVLFSLGNLIQHVRGLWRLRGVARAHGTSVAPKRWWTCLWWASTYAVLSMVLWVLSALFHARDTWWTERGDYLGVALASLASMQWTAVRLLPSWIPSSLTALPLAVAFVRHAYWLLAFPRFDYEYNMKFNLAIGAIHNAIWTAYGVYLYAAGAFSKNPTIRATRKQRARWCLGMSVGLTASMVLELLDFPPLAGRSLDAHALWHLSTIFIIPSWYKFIASDAEVWAVSGTRGGDGVSDLPHALVPGALAANYGKVD
ncbi:hypothetical protein H9P43_003740 [Blastocladiella emersonii ATCC 22665]|nr:hypothetical protein H9P43_003740 [Blastocladiella emersonii ATCC 22665]